ncbi:MAG: hypothetical protein MUC59_08125, partial [Saprospiraceae bacterium]|nr:hypothetical protein [Saprospiraceae bacterium]
ADKFFDNFAKRISRFVERIIILPLHGQESATTSVSDALSFLKQYQEGNAQKPFTRYEITIKYNTGDKIEASFKEKTDAIQFLESYG